MAAEKNHMVGKMSLLGKPTIGRIFFCGQWTARGSILKREQDRCCFFTMWSTAMCFESLGTIQIRAPFIYHFYHFHLTLISPATWIWSHTENGGIRVLLLHSKLTVWTIIRCCKTLLACRRDSPHAHHWLAPEKLSLTWSCLSLFALLNSHPWFDLGEDGLKSKTDLIISNCTPEHGEPIDFVPQAFDLRLLFSGNSLEIKVQKNIPFSS